MRASFSERMAAAHELAQVARNRGAHTGKSAKGWSFKRPVANDNYWFIAEQRKAWAQACVEIRNHFAAVCLSGPHDNPDNWEL